MKQHRYQLYFAFPLAPFIRVQIPAFLEIGDWLQYSDPKTQAEVMSPVVRLVIDVYESAAYLGEPQPVIMDAEPRKDHVMVQLQTTDHLIALRHTTAEHYNPQDFAPGQQLIIEGNVYDILQRRPRYCVPNNPLRGAAVIVTVELVDAARPDSGFESPQQDALNHAAAAGMPTYESSPPPCIIAHRARSAPPILPGAAIGHVTPFYSINFINHKAGVEQPQVFGSNPSRAGIQSPVPQPIAVQRSKVGRLRRWWKKLPSFRKTSPQRGYTLLENKTPFKSSRYSSFDSVE